MPSGNILTATDALNRLINGIDKTTLETELIASGWTCHSLAIEQLAQQPLALTS